MEKFWAVILIFVIVAAGGLLYVNQVYNPQKETQMAMADVANQTLSAVKSEIENGGGDGLVSVEAVKYAVRSYCSKPGNTVKISVKTNAEPVEYVSKYSGIDTQLEGITGQFYRISHYEDGKLKRIEFKLAS